MAMEVDTSDEVGYLMRNYECFMNSLRVGSKLVYVRFYICISCMFSVSTWMCRFGRHSTYIVDNI